MRPDHRDLLWVAVCVNGQQHAARHNAAPFGCAASVQAWDRIGAYLLHVCRRRLRVVFMRYFDDYFGVEKGDVAEHALGCVVRVIRAILGAASVADHKTSWGVPLTVLGLQLSVSQARRASASK